MMANSLKPTPEPTKQSTKQPVKKQKKLRYTKALSKDKARGSLRPYHFNVLAQLANISARIILYEFLRLSKSTREALREALVELRLSWPEFRLNQRRMKKTASTYLNMSPE